MMIEFENILRDSWTLLALGTTDRKHAFHTPVLGTLGDGLPQLRTVVLRGVKPETRLLYCHTDTRSPKFSELVASPVASWLFYSAAEKIQLRAEGKVTLHTADAVSEAHWQTSQLTSRRTYTQFSAPGTRTDAPTSGLPEFLIGRTPSAKEAEAGRANFAVIECKIFRLDWLQLTSDGNRRAVFEWSNSDVLTSSWVVP